MMTKTQGPYRDHNLTPPEKPQMSLKNKIKIVCYILLVALMTETVLRFDWHRRTGTTVAHQLYVAETAAGRAVQRMYGQRVTSVYCYAPPTSEDRCNESFGSNGAYCRPRWAWMQRETVFCCDTRDGAKNGGCYITH